MTANKTDSLVEHILDLKIEAGRDDSGFVIEQDIGSGEFSRIYIQPVHVERLAFHMGLQAPTDPQVAQHLKTIATLVRRLRKLHERIDLTWPTTSAT